jgi:NTE family protein
MESPSPRVALVLAGGAAHGAYQAGVLRYLFDELARDLGGPPRLDVLCGTSAGAINACALAAYADRPAEGMARLAGGWGSLRLADLLVPSATGMLAMAATLGGVHVARQGALLAQRPLRELLTRLIPFDRIGHHLRAGQLSALAVSTTHVGSGRTVVFVDGGRAPFEWEAGETVARPAAITCEHLLASCAVPLLFPALSLDGQLHCDGGLRQMLPLAPALRLGADAVLVINARHFSAEEPASIERARERAYGSPLFLLGRTLDVLLVDRVSDDLERLRQVNAILDAVAERHGPRALAELEQAMGQAGHRAVRRVPTVEIRTSRDLAVLAAEFVRSPRFLRHAGQVYGRFFRCLADAEGSGETTFLSYLLFDGAFASDLMDLGYADARLHRRELGALFQVRKLQSARA